MTSKLKLKSGTKIKIPTTPGYLSVFGSASYFPISKLTDQELEEVGKEWTRILIEKARLMRSK